MEVIIDEFIPVPFFLFDQKLFQKTFEVFEETTVTMTQTFLDRWPPGALWRLLDQKTALSLQFGQSLETIREGTYTSLDAP